MRPVRVGIRPPITRFLFCPQKIEYSFLLNKDWSWNPCKEDKDFFRPIQHYTGPCGTAKPVVSKWTRLLNKMFLADFLRLSRTIDLAVTSQHRHDGDCFTSSLLIKWNIIVLFGKKRRNYEVSWFEKAASECKHGDCWCYWWKKMIWKPNKYIQSREMLIPWRLKRCIWWERCWDPQIWPAWQLWHRAQSWGPWW